MGPLSTTIYRGLVIPALRIVVALLSPFRSKIAQRRREEQPAWEHARKKLLTDSRRRVWFHAASMGELEQLLPIIERVKEHHSDVCVVTTSTSPSGRDHALRQRCIDHALYLPLDSSSAMQRFVHVVNPTCVVIDRYDVWPSMISTLQRRDVPVHLVNATMPSAATKPFLRSFVARMYSQLTTITAVTQTDAVALSHLLGRDIPFRTDTRMDRVSDRVTRAAAMRPLLPEWNGGTLVLGSSWLDDERLMIDAWKRSDIQAWRLVIVPHEPSESAMTAIEQQISCRRLSHLQRGEMSATSPHILVDSVGQLLELYGTASAAYVGGGFGAGVHSLAEPAGFGIPLACGPNVARSRDASMLLTVSALTIIKSVDDGERWLRDLHDPSFCKSMGTEARSIVTEHTGSSDYYLDMIRAHLKSKPPTE
ncbi:MAG: 3-deoxy-D-manno-octulosonic acid transferase [Candidatus Kapaibacterium sp.]